MITAEEYRAIQMGMTYDEVARVIGFLGEEQSRSRFGDLETVLIAWTNPGLLGGSANVTFQNGRATVKAHFALPSVTGSERAEPGEIADIEAREAAEKTRQLVEVEIARKRLAAESVAEDQAAAEALYREFSDSTGKFKVRARFVTVSDDGAKLRRGDGKVLVVPLEKLSEADRQWINERMNRAN